MRDRESVMVWVSVVNQPSVDGWKYPRIDRVKIKDLTRLNRELRALCF